MYHQKKIIVLWSGLQEENMPLSHRPFILVNSVSEKWFHDLNSQNKFLPHRQNKIFKCVRKLFYFCEWQNNSCNTY